MSLKRVHPSLNSNPFPSDPEENTIDDDLSDYECFRKRVKKDPYDPPNPDQIQDELALSNDLNLQTQNLYGQEFQNLKACSFKTISRIGQDKFSSLLKNQGAQFDDKFSHSYKKKNSLLNLSEEKIRQQTFSKNIVRNQRKSIASFGSLNQISKLDKKNSIESYKHNEMRNRLKKIESSISGFRSGSMNSINTQMMNEMMDFNINDDNEVDEIYLNKMMETALIKNVRFSANLRIVFCERNNETQFYQNIKMFKILEVDGFSINSFYASGEKIRINLKKTITNKEFQKKIVFQPQSHPNIDTTKQQSTRENRVQFQGKYYDFTTHEFEEVKFYLSEVKDNVNTNSPIGNDEIENINFENWMIPQDSFDCSSFGCSNFMAHRN